MEVMSRLSNMGFQFPSLTCPWPLLSANLSAQETNSGAVPYVITSSLVEDGLNWTTAFCFYRNKHLPVFGFTFPACSASAKTTICELKECLIHCRDIPQSFTSDQGTHFTPEES